MATSAGSYRLEDLGSLNGTYINNESVAEVSLASGDEIQIGKVSYASFLKGKK